MNEILIPAVAAILAAFIGVFLSNWYKRGKPWIGISSIDRDDSTLVEVGDDVIELYHSSTYFNGIPIRQYEPLYKLKNQVIEVSNAKTMFEETFTMIDSFLKKAKEGYLSELEKRQALSILLSNQFFMSTLQFLNKTNNLPLSVEESQQLNTEQKSLLKLEKYEDKTNKQFGVILYGDKTRFYITIDGIITEESIKRTHKLGAILSSFSLNEILPILEYMKTYLNNEIQISLNIGDKINRLIISRRLMVKVKVSNTGGTPVHIEPYGLLKVKSSGKPVPPMIIEVAKYNSQEPGAEELSKMMQIFEGMASKMGIESSFSPSSLKTSPEYIIVNPGALIEIELYTIGQIEDSQIVNALESGILSSQVILKKANSKKNNIIKSDYQTMGVTISQEKINELELLSTKV